MRIQFATQSYRSKSLPVSAQRVVNMYAAAQPKDAKNDIAVFGNAGLVDFATCGIGPVRAMHMLGGVVHACRAGRSIQVSEQARSPRVGWTRSPDGPVSVDDNGDQLAIVNGTAGYIYSTDGGFQLISDTDFHPAEHRDLHRRPVRLRSRRHQRVLHLRHARRDRLQRPVRVRRVEVRPGGQGAQSSPDALRDGREDDRAVVFDGRCELSVPAHRAGGDRSRHHRAARGGERGPEAFHPGQRPDRAPHRGGQIAPISTDAINEAWQDYASGERRAHVLVHL
jgi:hypothetical protein